MRNISFMLTTNQITEQTKDVTRRMGWKFAKPGMLLQGIVKGQGLKKGEKVEKLAVIRVKSVRRERLNEMVRRPTYGKAECRREGFPNSTPADFVDFFCWGHKGCRPSSIVTRIEFEYVKDGAG
jgi:hypothetical protein